MTLNMNAFRPTRVSEFFPDRCLAVKCPLVVLFMVEGSFLSCYHAREAERTPFGQVPVSGALKGLVWWPDSFATARRSNAVLRHDIGYHDVLRHDFGGGQLIRVDVGLIFIRGGGG